MIYTTKQVAKEFGVTSGAVSIWVLKKGCPHMRTETNTLFFDLDAVREWHKKYTVRTSELRAENCKKNRKLTPFQPKRHLPAADNLPSVNRVEVLLSRIIVELQQLRMAWDGVTPSNVGTNGTAHPSQDEEKPEA